MVRSFVSPPSKAPASYELVDRLPGTGEFSDTEAGPSGGGNLFLGKIPLFSGKNVNFWIRFILSLLLSI